MAGRLHFSLYRQEYFPPWTDRRLRSEVFRRGYAYGPPIHTIAIFRVITLFMLYMYNCIATQRPYTAFDEFQAFTMNEM